VRGYLVSDRTYFKLEKGGPPEREVHPPELFDRHAHGEACAAGMAATTFDGCI